MTLLAQTESDLRLNIAASLIEYPVRRESLKGFFRAESNLDVSRRNLAAPVGFPRLAQVIGSPAASVVGMNFNGNTDYLATDVPESAISTQFVIAKSSDTFADGATRPMFYSNFDTEGCSLYVSAAGASSGRGRVVANSYSVDSQGDKTNSQAFVDEVDMRNYICMCAVHTKDQVRLYFPGTDIPTFIRNRPPGNTRLLGARNMRIGSSYSGGASFAGQCSVLFVADWAAELSESEINDVRAAELAFHGLIGSGQSF